MGQKCNTTDIDRWYGIKHSMTDRQINRWIDRQVHRYVGFLDKEADR